MNFVSFFLFGCFKRVQEEEEKDFSSNGLKNSLNLNLNLILACYFKELKFEIYLSN